MALPTGTITISNVNTELGRPSTQQLNLNDSEVRKLANKPTNQSTISMNDLRGKAKVSIVVSANTAPTYNLYAVASASGNYVANSTYLVVTINPGVRVGSVTVPSNFGPADRIELYNNGSILGQGGDGAPPSAGVGIAGGAGGVGLNVARPITVYNYNLIAGGGGGGGGSGYEQQFYPRPPRNGGPITYTAPGGSGGGGAGFNVIEVNPLNGLPGVSGGLRPVPSLRATETFGTPGSNGPLGGNFGGNGGNLGLPGITGSSNFAVGGAGGAAGNAVTGNSFITWASMGTITGNIA